jgi:hypothetical protein
MAEQERQKTYNVKLEARDGSIVVRRVSAENPTEAAQRALRGEGLVLTPPAPEGTRAQPAIGAEPPPPPTGGTVVEPRLRGPQPGGLGVTETLLRGVTDTVLPAVGRFAGRAALPTAGSAALGLAGQAIPGVRLLPRPIREGIGSVLGTGANMALGIEPFDINQLLLSASMPAAAPGVARAAGQVPFATRQATQLGRATELAESAAAVPQLLRGKITIDPTELFETARELNPRLALTTTGATSTRLLAREGEAAAGLKFPRVRQIAEDLQQSATKVKAGVATEIRFSPILDDAGRPILREEIVRITPEADGRIPLRELDTTRRRIGALIGIAHDGEERQAYRALYGAILTDMEEAASRDGSEGARLLLKGIAEQRRSYAADSLADMVVTASGKPRPDGLVQIDFGGILKTLRNPRSNEAELLSDFLKQNPAEGKEIISLFEDMHRRNIKFLPPAGSMFGSGVQMSRLSVGGIITGGVNAVAGKEFVPWWLGPAVYNAGVNSVMRLATTSLGRAYLRQLYQPLGTLNLTQVVLQGLGQGLRIPATAGAEFLVGKARDFIESRFPQEEEAR